MRVGVEVGGTFTDVLGRRPDGFRPGHVVVGEPPRQFEVVPAGQRIAGGMVVENQIRPSSTLISFNFCCSPG